MTQFDRLGRGAALRPVCGPARIWRERGVLSLTSQALPVRARTRSACNRIRTPVRLASSQVMGFCSVLIPGLRWPALSPSRSPTSSLRQVAPAHSCTSSSVPYYLYKLIVEMCHNVSTPPSARRALYGTDDSQCLTLSRATCATGHRRKASPLLPTLHSHVDANARLPPAELSV